MSHRSRMMACALIAGLALAPVSAAGQSPDAPEPPRTPWGQPDLQGIWDFRTITPLQRPEDRGDQEFLTKEEAASLEQAAVDEADQKVRTLVENANTLGFIEKTIK